VAAIQQVLAFGHSHRQLAKPMVAIGLGYDLRHWKPSQLVAAIDVGGSDDEGRSSDFSRKSSRRGRFGRPLIPAVAFSMFIALGLQASLADEGGVSCWLPGTFGSLAAVPGQPVWSFATFGCNTNVSTGANVAAARPIEIGALNATLRANLSANLHADVAFDFSTLQYAFARLVADLLQQHRGQSGFATAGLP
jgi:hypothetical protein